MNEWRYSSETGSGEARYIVCDPTLDQPIWELPAAAKDRLRRGLYVMPHEVEAMREAERKAQEAG